MRIVWFDRGGGGMGHNRRQQPGFTLIEVLVVVGILSLLVALLLPSLGRSKEIAKRAVCGSNLRQIGVAITMYGSSNRDSGPPWTGGVYDFVMSDNAGPKGYRTTAWMEAIYPFLGGRGDPRLLRTNPELEAQWEGQKVLQVYYCPGRRCESQYFSSYFYNALPSCVEFLARQRTNIKDLETKDPGRPIAVDLYKAVFPSAFILVGDCGAPNQFRDVGLDWDRDNASQDMLPWAAADEERSSAHGKAWNVLFLDGHVDAKESFTPGSMTYAYDKLAVSYGDLAPER